MGFNIIAEDGRVKTTINFPRKHILAARVRMKQLGIEHFSVYVNALIRMDIESKSPMSLKQFLGYYENPKETASEAIDRVVAQRAFYDKPRKYPGVGTNLVRSSSRFLRWFQRQNEHEKQQEFNFFKK